MNSFNNTLSQNNTQLSAESKILFGQCGSNKKLQLTELMEYCADYVMDLYAQRGQTRQFLADKGYVQMVSRASIHIEKLPAEDQVITVTVREEKPEGFQFMRYYEFTDSDGKVLVQGKSLWVVVHPETRAIVGPDNFEYLAPGDIQTPFEKKPGKIKIPEGLAHLGDQKILLSHLDPNGHLTNAKYINFAIDFLPDQYQEKEITDFRLNFCKEMRKGEIMHIFGAFDDENKKIVVVGKRQQDENPEKMESSFECELFYR